MAAPTLDTKRYDRQIRLWGMETQLRMTTTRVLICGVGGLAAEVAKNLVLAGVGHVTLQDHAAVTADDLARGGQFLLGEAAVGQNRAEASLAFLRGLNPSVEVVACSDDVRLATAEHLSQYDIAVLTELEVAHVVKLGLLAREARAPAGELPAKRKRAAADDDDGAPAAPRRRVHVIGAGAAGLYGWAALDLGDYAFSKTSKKGGAEGESVTEACRIAYPTFEVRARAAQPSARARSPRLTPRPPSLPPRARDPPARPGRRPCRSPRRPSSRPTSRRCSPSTTPTAPGRTCARARRARSSCCGCRPRRSARRPSTRSRRSPRRPSLRSAPSWAA